MDSNEILLTTVIASVIWLLMLFLIIRGATNSTKKIELMEKQNRFSEMNLMLLAELLKKQGVTEEHLREIIDLKKSYFAKNV
jgi:hypothetical protein